MRIKTLVIIAFAVTSVALAQRQEAVSETINVQGQSFKMIKVEGGSFKMGATPEQGLDNSDAKPVHEVTLSTFFIGETEVTQELWEAVMGKNPSFFKGKNLPVETIIMSEILEFIEKLNALSGKTFRLPTEAEWEFAARGGNKSRNTKYAGSDNAEQVSWFLSNSGKKAITDEMEVMNAEKNGNKTHKVKSKAPNELGIYDMSGNVFEFCSDCSLRNIVPYFPHPQTNPKFSKYPDPAEMTNRTVYIMIRGGSWVRMPMPLAGRVAIRDGSANNATGFRLVMEE